jgi:hypothetical protein
VPDPADNSEDLPVLEGGEAPAVDAAARRAELRAARDAALELRRKQTLAMALGDDLGAARAEVRRYGIRVDTPLRIPERPEPPFPPRARPGRRFRRLLSGRPFPLLEPVETEND